MENARKRAYAVTGIVAFLVFLFFAFYYGLLNPLAVLFADLGAEWGLALINGIATTVLAAVTALQMMEARKMRAELVRPHLSLEPAYFVYDTKTGAIVGFNCLDLVNGGIVARDVEIDVSFKGSPNLLYVSAIGTDSRVKIWSGEALELGGVATVALRYKDLLDKRHSEVLSINIDSLNSVKRKFVPVHRTSAGGLAAS
jgi:uncharacterized membrane protein (UPF0136 family)